jgi:hypothetical protein
MATSGCDGQKEELTRDDELPLITSSGRHRFCVLVSDQNDDG